MEECKIEDKKENGWRMKNGKCRSKVARWNMQDKKSLTTD